MIRKLLLVLICLSLNLVKGQDENTNYGVLPTDIPTHNLVRYNRFYFNPTFSLVREGRKSINVYNKVQWAGFNDNPQTYLINYTSNFDEQIGVGLGLHQQNEGVYRYFGGIANFAYNLEFNDDMNFTFGLNLGFSQSGVKSNIDSATSSVLNSGVQVDDPVLLSFENSSSFQLTPGINFNYTDFDVGVSVVNLVVYNLSASELLTDNMAFNGHIMYTTAIGGRRSDKTIRGMGYANMLADANSESRLRYGGSVILDLPKLGWAQGGYNSFYGVSLGIGGNVTPTVSIGYSYEMGLGDTSTFGSTHEIALAYNFATERKSSGGRKTNSQKAYEARDSEIRRLKKEILEQNRLIRNLQGKTGDSVSRAQKSLSRLEKQIEEAKEEEANRARALALKREQELKLLNKKTEEEKLAAQKTLEREMTEQELKMQAQKKLEREVAEQKRLESLKKLEMEMKVDTSAEEARIAAEEAAREAEAAKQQEEEERLAAQKKAQEEAAQAARLAEEERLRQEAEAARLAEEERLRQEAEGARLAEEERKKQEAEAARLAEEERLRQEAEAARLAQEAEAARLAEEERLRQEAETARLAQEAEAARLAEEERLRQEAEAARLAQEAEAARLAEEERLRQEAEAARLAEEERKKQEAEAARIAAEEAAKLAEAERLKQEAAAAATENEEGLEEIKKELDNSKRISSKIFARQDSLLNTGLNVDKREFNKLLESLVNMDSDVEDERKDTSPTSSKQLAAKNRFIKFAEASRPEAQYATKFIPGYPEGYYLIGNVFKGGVYAEKFTSSLKDLGFNDAQIILNPENDFQYVSIEHYTDKDEAARKYLNNIDNRFFGDMWILHIAQSRVASFKQLLQETRLVKETVKDDTVVTENLSYIGGHNIKNGYYLIASIFKRENYFARGMERLRSRGLEPQFFRNPKDNYIYVYLKRFDNLDDAKQSLFSNVNNTYDGDLYILKIQ